MPELLLSYTMLVAERDVLLLEVDLPQVILFAPGAMGSSVCTAFESRPFVVHLPVATTGYPPVLLRPAVLDGLTPEPRYADGTEHPDDPDAPPDSPWGYPATVNDDPSTNEYCVKRLVLSFDDVISAEVEAATKEAVRFASRWFSDVRAWCEVLADQDLDHVAPRTRASIEGSGCRAHYGGNSPSTLGRISVDFNYGNPLTSSMWGEVLALVAQDPEVFPPDNWRLLRSAQRAHVRRNYRQAVVDAATAIEISLHSLIESEHRRAPTGFSKDVVDRLGKATLGRLAQVADAVHVLPSTYTEGLTKLRNSVVHKTAYEPTKEDSEAMLQAARDAVRSATPHPAGVPREVR